MTRDWASKIRNLQGAHNFKFYATVNVISLIERATFANSIIFPLATPRPQNGACLLRQLLRLVLALRTHRNMFTAPVSTVGSSIENPPQYVYCASCNAWFSQRQPTEICLMRQLLRLFLALRTHRNMRQLLRLVLALKTPRNMRQALRLVLALKIHRNMFIAPVATVGSRIENLLQCDSR